MFRKEKKEKRPLISKLLFVVLFLALVYLYARYVGTTGIKINEYNITSGDIPESFDGFSIVQFSDLELGSTFNVSDVNDLVKAINSLNPDIVVFTGDLVSKDYNISVKDRATLVDNLKNIDPLIGKYSVIGDNDIENNIYESVMEEAEFKDITNNYELIYYKGLTPIVLYGLDSLNKGTQNFETTFAYPNENTDSSFMATYRILLAHEPDTASLVGEYNIALMLAGHSHNSQVNIPYLRDLYKIQGAEKYYNEHYNVGGMELYVSSGLGTSVVPLRLNSRPSISIFRLYRD